MVQISGEITFLPPRHLWYEMENGVYEKVIGTILNGAWRPQDIKFYVSYPFGKNNYGWQEIDEQLATSLDWNKITTLIEQKYEDGSLKEKKVVRIPQVLESIGVLTMQETPMVTVNGVVTQTNKQLTMNPDYVFSFPNDVEQPPHVIDIEYKESGNA